MGTFLVLMFFGFLLIHIYGSALLDEPAFYWNTPKAQEARATRRSLAYLRWRPWYAWHPVKLRDGSWVWFGWVDRIRGWRAYDVCDGYGLEHCERGIWEYRLA